MVIDKMRIPTLYKTTDLVKNIFSINENRIGKQQFGLRPKA